MLRLGTALLALSWCCHLVRGEDSAPGSCRPTSDDPDGDCIIGEARIDYPTLLSVPPTSFRCADQEHPGMYADVETDCQAFHFCPPGSLGGSSKPRTGAATFLCTPGSLFNQQYRVCDWWFNVPCHRARAYYVDNSRFYDTSIGSNSLRRDDSV